MPIIHCAITARSPLVFSERRPGGQFRQSMSYVPGTVLRGALAQQFLDSGKKDNPDFSALFTAPDAPLFRNAYPAYFDKTRSPKEFLPSHPLPATAFSCKAESGFDRHDVFDSLIDRLCCEELDVMVPYLPRCNHSDHNGEGERVETFGGFYVKGLQGKTSTTAPSKLTTRVALNRRRRVAEEGLLYSPLVISEATQCGTGYMATTFHGSIVANDQNCGLIEQYLPTLTHVGSGAARGFGWVKAEIGSRFNDDLAKRVKEFNNLVAKQWGLWRQLPHREKDPKHTPETGTFFTVLLMSDAIFRADGWTPTVRLEPALLGLAGQDTDLLRCYATADYRGGWNTGWGLPKDTEMVARMGSVYIYHTSHKSDDEEWLNTLQELEEHGVGERRVEGFGQVRVCDEFHLQIQEVRLP